MKRRPVRGRIVQTVDVADPVVQVFGDQVQVQFGGTELWIRGHAAALDLAERLEGAVVRHVMQTRKAGTVPVASEDS